MVSWLAFGYGGLVCAFGIYLMFGSRDIPLLFLPVYLPLFLLVGLLSYPHALMMAKYLAFKERRFVREMKLADRLMSWQTFTEVLAERRGTVIEEWFSLKEPVHYWWVEDNLTTSSPHKWTHEGCAALIYENEYATFSSWCYERYLNNGKARLLESRHISELQSANAEHKLELDIPVVAISAAQRSRREKPSPRQAI